MKLKLYLDTSVFSARYDSRTPERAAETDAFFRRSTEFAISTSDLARLELERTVDLERRAQLLTLLDGVDVYPITVEMTALARRYIDAGVFTAAMFDDAQHVAAAVLMEQSVLVSWNFRHLVNRGRRARINLVNTSLGLPSLEILAPPEIQ